MKEAKKQAKIAMDIANAMDQQSKAANSIDNDLKAAKDALAVAQAVFSHSLIIEILLLFHHRPQVTKNLEFWIWWHFWSIL